MICLNQGGNGVAASASSGAEEAVTKTPHLSKVDKPSIKMSTIVQDPSVTSAQLLYQRSPATRPDFLLAAGGFIAVILVWFNVVAGPSWLWGYAVSAGFLLCALLGFLLEAWFVSVRSAARYVPLQLSDVGRATHVCVVPAPNCGTAAIHRIERETPVPGAQDPVHGATFFVHQKIKYVLHRTPDGAPDFFKPIDFPVNLPVVQYLHSQGFQSPREMEKARHTYGHNIFDIPLPTFNELFAEHAVAPFFVFQMFCVVLWMMDEYWYYSALTAVMLVVFESTIVKRRLRNLQDLRNMRIPPHTVSAFRGGKWTAVSSSDLLPGDIVALNRTKEGLVVSCDILLLAGTVVANEALLTGESVPQLKEPVEADQAGRLLDMDDTHKRNIVWGGTTIIMHSGPTGECRVKAPPHDAAVGYVLRTGFNTSQGGLVRTILFSTERVSVNNAEALMFIFVLLIFAVIAAAYVLKKGLENETRSRYKLLLNCIMIVTSVVPPELPMELSLAVTNSLVALMKTKVFCTEPFRIPLGGAVDVCCFDKTGTLTADQFNVQGIAGLDPPLREDRRSVIPAMTAPLDVPDHVKIVLAGCHSLARVSDVGLVGDPMEQAAMKAIEWSFSKGDVAVPVRGGPATKGLAVRIIRRFPFSSALKRMSCIVAVERDGLAWRIVSKGAPEVMGPLFKQLPPDYDASHKFYSRQGCRILALGTKTVETPSVQDRLKLQRCSRDEVEHSLEFCGFLVLQCPMKKDSLSVVRELRMSSHNVIMITGDHVLTGCHVAKELQIATRPLLVLETKTEASAEVKQQSLPNVLWTTTKEDQTLPFDVESVGALAKEYDLCASGFALDAIARRLGEDRVGRLVVPHVKVWARTSPVQKEFVVTWLKNNGFTTLMCGDGTNDVGALKQAHVGVALIGHEHHDVTGDSLARDRALPKGSNKLSTRERKLKKLREQTEALTQRKANKKKKAARDSLEASLAKLEGDDPGPVRLGDASIASPFTSKTPFITSTVNIIRQGRCTLVATMQVFEILAVNCLLTAYSMSVLTLDGVKMGDTQMTVSGLAVAAFFFFVSASKPLPNLSPQRPQSKLFTIPMLLSVAGQFVGHLYCLMVAVQWSKPHTPRDKDTQDPDSDFKPNVLNTVVYLMATCMTVATFLANYQGHPFMQSLRENVLLWRGLMGMNALLVTLALEIMPPLNRFFELHPLPSKEFGTNLVLLMAADTLVTTAYAHLLRKLFAVKPAVPTLPSAPGEAQAIMWFAPHGVAGTKPHAL